MKKICLLIGLAGVMTTFNLFGSMNVTLTQSSYSAGNGGEFTASGDSGLNSVVNWNAYSASTSVKGVSFQTFCIEETETFYPGQSFVVHSIMR